MMKDEMGWVVRQEESKLGRPPIEIRARPARPLTGFLM